MATAYVELSCISMAVLDPERCVPLIIRGWWYNLIGLYDSVVRGLH